MDPVKRLEQLDKEVAAVTAKVDAAWEAYNHAAAATTQAVLAQSEALEDRKLQQLHDAAEREERRAQEHYESLKEEKKQLLEERRALQAKLLSSGWLEPIPENTMLEIREGLASLVKMSENIEEMRVMSQISGLMAWKALRWTLSTASDGDMRPSNNGFKDTLMEKYFPGAERAEIVCMVTGVKTSTIAAHLMSHSKKDIAQPMLAIDNIDFWRNGLLWCLPVEQAWEDSRICLTYHPVPTPGFLLHVLDDRMLNLPITADFPGVTEGHLTKMLGAGAKRALEGKLWKDLHGGKINYHFTKDTLPYKRAVAFHAKCAYRQAAQRGYVPASFDATLVDHDHWSVEGARQKVESYLKGLQGVTLSAEEISPDDSPDAAASPAGSEHPLSEEQYFSTPHGEETTL